MSTGDVGTEKREGVKVGPHPCSCLKVSPSVLRFLLKKAERELWVAQRAWISFGERSSSMIASPPQENSVPVTTGVDSLGSISSTSGMHGGTTLKCVSFMRHSIAVHNEAAAACINAVDSVYRNEVYADSR